jgi:transcriptional regulator with XRE-family HTH domain
VELLKAADDIDAYVGSRVRLRRMTVGVSQEQLGEALGLTFQQVQKYEKGQNRIGAGRLYRIAQILSTPVEFFYEGLPPTATEAEAGPIFERSAEIQTFLASPEGHALCFAFQRIRNPSTRRRIVDLVETIANGEG